MRIQTLKQEFESVVDSYVSAFCRKHDFDMDYCSWVGNRKGEVLEVADYYFGFDDIRCDIDKKLPTNTILEWYDATLEHAFCPEHHNINFDSWSRGLRYEKPFTKLQLLKWRLKPIWETIHWNFVGKKQMKRKFNQTMKEFL